MTSRYRRSDHAALLFISGLLFLFAGISSLIVDSGDAELLKTISVIIYFTLAAGFIVISFLYNSTGHSITISDKVMAIKCYKEFMFVSGELAKAEKALFWYRTFTVNIADIESFSELNGREIYQYSFDKHFPMHLTMRPVIADSFIGEMLISFVKCSPGRLNALYDHETEDISETAMDEATKKALSDFRFLIFNLKDKRQVILYLRGYSMFDVLRIISHITSVSHLRPLFQSNHPEVHFQEKRFTQSKSTLFLYLSTIIPTLVLLSAFILIEPAPHDIYFYPLKSILIFITTFFGHRFYYNLMRIYYQSKRKQLKAFLTKYYIVIHVLEFSFYVFMLIFVEYLLLAVNT